MQFRQAGPLSVPANSRKAFACILQFISPSVSMRDSTLRDCCDYMPAREKYLYVQSRYRLQEDRKPAIVGSSFNVALHRRHNRSHSLFLSKASTRLDRAHKSTCMELSRLSRRETNMTMGTLSFFQCHWGSECRVNVYECVELSVKSREIYYLHHSLSIARFYKSRKRKT